MDYKKKILDSLETLRIRDIESGERFPALAYLKAIKELKKLDSITKLEDVETIPGVGAKIKLKIKEILETGELRAATEAKKDLSIDVYQDLLNVYGIGPVKAKELISKHKIKSIADLRQHQELLNEKQKLGLKYYEDALERIPREEMEQHEAKIQETIELEATIVGSYRRGLPTSGDIDVLIKIPEDFTKKQQKDMLEKIVEQFTEDNYIIDVLALGDKKCMAFVSLGEESSKARRLDLLITPESEYPYALLYFTGSDQFNVAFRRYALTKKYSLNEHTMKPTEGGEVPNIKTEKDIFDFLGLAYKEPAERINEMSVVEKVEKEKEDKEEKKIKPLTMTEAKKLKKNTTRVKKINNLF